MSAPIKLAIVGAGKRGEAYADYALKHPDLAQVVAVAEPREALRRRMAEAHGITSECCFDGYASLAKQPKLADAVLICVQDAMHLEALEALAPLGYAVLLEKPMAQSWQDCERVAQLVRQHGNFFAVCHVLLYTELTMALRSLLQQGVIGDVVSVQHLEPVAWWHQAHSFVRGSWRNQTESAPMLLAKSCHDMDWMRHIVGRRCLRVSSFGSLRHFTAENRPEGAADRCLDCGCESTCAYSAKKIYWEPFDQNDTVRYLNDIVTEGENTREALERALAEGPYGRCVYACDNDVVDHQTVMLEYEGPVSANFTMTAFTPTMPRSCRIFGTQGYIETDFSNIKVFDFLTQQETIHDTKAQGDGMAASGHGGGDYHLMRCFVHALATGDTSEIHSGLDETMESHRIVFAAELARREGRVVCLDQQGDARESL